MFSKVFSWAFLIVTTTICFALIMIAMGFSWGMAFVDIFTRKVALPKQSIPVYPLLQQLRIDASDQRCAVDSDCAMLITQCRSCEYGGTVNQAVAQKYLVMLYQDLCRNYRPWLCETESGKYARCVNNNCILSDLPSYNAYADWQIYRHKELGFKFQYPKDWTLKEDIDTIQLYGDRESFTILLKGGNRAGWTDYGVYSNNTLAGEKVTIIHVTTGWKQITFDTLGDFRIILKHDLLPGEDSQGALARLDKVLSTFRFINNP